VKDLQRETLGREGAILRRSNGSTYEGSVELHDLSSPITGYPAVAEIVEVEDRSYVWRGRSCGRHEYVEAFVDGWEPGPARCSARESGGVRCRLPANHAGGHEWRGANR